mgnify:CR=1 FL=1
MHLYGFLFKTSSIKISKMKVIHKSIILFAFFFFFAMQVTAQVFDDWEARPNVSLKYKINKDWTVSGTYYLYLENNMSQYDKSVFGTEVSYKINPWMKAGIDYRFGTNAKEQYHDLRYSLSFDMKLSNKWTLEYQPTLQQEFTSLNKEHLALHPVEYYVRNRITANYELSKVVELFVFTENYLQPVDGDVFFYRQKSALGADFEINEHHKIGTRFEIINKNSGKNYARPNLSYTYTFGYSKKKEK